MPNSQGFPSGFQLIQHQLAISSNIFLRILKPNAIRMAYLFLRRELKIFRRRYRTEQDFRVMLLTFECDGDFSKTEEYFQAKSVDKQKKLTNDLSKLIWETLPSNPHPYRTQLKREHPFIKFNCQLCHLKQQITATEKPKTAHCMTGLSEFIFKLPNRYTVIGGSRWKHFREEQIRRSVDNIIKKTKNLRGDQEDKGYFSWRLHHLARSRRPISSDRLSRMADDIRLAIIDIVSLMQPGENNNNLTRGTILDLASAILFLRYPGTQALLKSGKQEQISH
ncbi:MAG: hypothetical protein HQL69_24655, partial [Magnetococcales bacterium]|nr:hypothetical protein [Magnetococcales bacterium]